jgi:rhodanese-related sulfurtransferase
MTEVVPKEIGRDGVRTLVRRGGQLVEVLPREEFEQLHLAGATSIPLSQFGRTLADRLKWDQPVLVYGSDHQDDRSARAAWRLASLGFTQIYRYTAGKADWLANGFPVEGTAAQSPGAGDMANMEVPTCKRIERVGEIRERVRKDGWNLCVVVNDQDIVLGLLKASAFDKANPEWSAEEAMEPDPPTFRLDAPPEQVIDYFKHNRWIDSVLVTTSDGQLFGLIRQEEARK